MLLREHLLDLLLVLLAKLRELLLVLVLHRHQLMGLVALRLRLLQLHLLLLLELHLLHLRLLLQMLKQLLVGGVDRRWWRLLHRARCLFDRACYWRCGCLSPTGLVDKRRGCDTRRTGEGLSMLSGGGVPVNPWK